ncbi:uncharacterized protein LOC113147332 [Cyclospora cayetanensis]|nr:uncharacterized protein LOC113147332 [Cyclospora cayetanensis]
MEPPRISLVLFLLLPVFAAAISPNSEAILEHLEKPVSLPPPPRPIRLILSDFDGTLTGEQGRFVEENIRGILLARKLGIQCGFSTGRGPSNIKRAIGEHAMGLSASSFNGSSDAEDGSAKSLLTPGIFMNGAFVVGENGEIVHDGPFSKDLHERLVEAFKRHGFSSFEYEKISKEEAILNPRIAEMPQTESAMKTHESEYAEEEMTPYYALSVHADSALIDEARSVLEQQFEGELEFTKWRSNALGAHRKGFSKGSGVIALCQALGLSPEEVLVMGDAENDLSMFSVAGTAVAVGNAMPVVKNAADFVTVDSSQGALLAVVKEIQQLGYYPGASKVNGDQKE